MNDKHYPQLGITVAGTAGGPAISTLPFLDRNRTHDFYFIYFLFSDRGEGREKEAERNINVWLPLVRSLLGTWPATQACALTGNRTGDPLVRSPAFNPLSHTSQGPQPMIFNRTHGYPE